MKNLFRIGVLLAPSLQILQAQPEIIAKFVTRQHPYSGGYLKYLLCVPEQYDSTRQYPLVLALHGGFYDFDLQMRWVRFASAWADPVNQADHPCFLVAPVYPTTSADWPKVYGTLIGIPDSLGGSNTACAGG